MTEEAGFEENGTPQHDRITTAEYTQSLSVIEAFAQRDISQIRILQQLTEAMGGAELGNALKAIILAKGHPEEEIPYYVAGEKKYRLTPGFRWEHEDPPEDPPRHTIPQHAFRAEYFDTEDGPKIRIKLGRTVLPPHIIRDKVKYFEEVRLPVGSPLEVTPLTEDDRLGLTSREQYVYILDTGAAPGSVGPDYAYGGGHGYGLGSYNIPFHPTLRNFYDDPVVQQGYANLLQKSVKKIVSATRPPATELPPV